MTVMMLADDKGALSSKFRFLEMAARRPTDQGTISLPDPLRLSRSAVYIISSG